MIDPARAMVHTHGMSAPKPKVTENDEHTFDGHCTVELCGYEYLRAPTRKAAREKLDDHMLEHDKADAA